MYKQQPRNVTISALSHTIFFLRHQFWPLLIPSLAVLVLVFCPQVSHALENNIEDCNQPNENLDRTVANLRPHELQQASALSGAIFSTSSTPSNSQFDDLNHALYVVTLDGRITAIDADANGRHLWTTDTGAALVDSSLSKIEISRDARSVRLIPSLIGGLYEKYDEDGHIEPLPFDADALLDASFKLHDELVITGGKYIDTLGVDVHTGQILYSFSKDDTPQKTTLDMNGTATDHHNPKATLVVKRTTQTVRARSARNGYEKWNFSVSNHELLHLHAQPANIVLERVDGHKTRSQRATTFSGYFEYQLQTGVVLAFDIDGHALWTSSINAPIAAVWELQNGQLTEKSLFETTHLHQPDDERHISPSLISRRLAFIGEFNSTPYVIVSPRVQKQLIFDARKIAGSHGQRRSILSSGHKAYQKRTLLIDSDLPENTYPPAIGVVTPEHSYPLALRPDVNGQHSSLLAPTTVETCDTAGYLELIHYFAQDDEPKDITANLSTHSNVNLPSNTLTISSIVLGAMIVILVWYYKQKQTELLRQKAVMTECTVTTNLSPPATPEYHQLEQPVTPSFQSRYTLEYEHVRFLGRGGFGVVFEAINQLDERRVAIKRVSLKKASGKERALKEIRYLAVLNHPNLIQYYYAWNESPPMGWQEEEDKVLLVKHNNMTRDSISSFPTSGNDSESVVQDKSSKLSPVYAIKPPTISPPPSLDFTFDRSSNPLRIDEDFSNNSIKNNDQSVQNSISSSSSSSSSDDQVNSNNNNTKSNKRNHSSTTTKSSVSSSSPLFDHSIDSSSLSDDDIEQHVKNNDVTESDDGIIFLQDDKKSLSSSPQQTQTKKCLNNEKESPPTYFYFVMELCQPESLRDRLMQRNIDRHQAWSIFDQIIKGIEYIHSQKLIHRDLKPSNILFSLDNTVKIGDFGLVSAFGEDKLAKQKKRNEDKLDTISPIETVSFTTDGGGNHEIGGTILYMSPEQINREPYNQKVDIYAMGIILFELFYPFSTQMERMQAIANVRLQKSVFPVEFEREGTNRNQLICRLIRWLLSHSPRDRPRASELRQDTFYQRMLQVEVPHLFFSDNHQSHSGIVNGQEQTPTCQQQHRGRISSSPFRRTVSSSILQCHRDSESGDIECLS